MMKFKSRATLNKFIYIMSISIAVACILFITGKMFSKVELSKTLEPGQNIIEEAKVNLASAEFETNSLKVSSRGNLETRKSESTTETKTESNAKTTETTQKKEASTTKTTSTKTISDKKNSSKSTSSTKTSSSSKSTSSTKTSTSSKSTSSTKTSSSSKSTSSTKTTSDSQKTETTETKTTNNKDENKKSATKTISISQVKISKNMDLTKRTGLSREDFIKLMSGVKADTSGFFKKNAGKIYDLCEKYSINEIFFCGLISAESGWNIASNHRKTHNYISLMKNGKLIKYSSVDEGLEVAAQKLHYNYLTPGGKFYHGKTLSGVKTCFCPSSGWVNLVYGRMKQIL